MVKRAMPSFTQTMHAHFFFVDIVGLSDPSLSTKTQIKKIKILNESIAKCKTYKSIPSEMILILPTGDGMCVGFLQGIEFPLQLAKELQQILIKHNKGKIPSETVRIRIGLHSGNCFIVKDIQGNDNVWGPGTIIARRVMDIGDSNHILLSSRIAEDLIESSDTYRKIIKPIGDVAIKHGQTLLIYSACGKNFGNSNMPSKGIIQKSRFSAEIKQIQETTIYPSLKVNLKIINLQKMFVQHERIYELMNISNKSINQVIHGIATDIKKKSLNDLNLHVYDEDSKEMKISSISLDMPTQKEFTTTFNRPILKNEKGRKYTLIYQVEEPERYFENAFLVDVKKFTLNFEFPYDEKNKITPIIYVMDQEKETKIKSNISSKRKKIGNSYQINFVRKDNVKGETVRIEW